MPVQPGGHAEGTDREVSGQGGRAARHSLLRSSLRDAQQALKIAIHFDPVLPFPGICSKEIVKKVLKIQLCVWSFYKNKKKPFFNGYQ